MKTERTATKSRNILFKRGRSLLLLGLVVLLLFAAMPALADTQPLDSLSADTAREMLLEQGFPSEMLDVYDTADLLDIYEDIAAAESLQIAGGTGESGINNLDLYVVEARYFDEQGGLQQIAVYAVWQWSFGSPMMRTTKDVLTLSWDTEMFSLTDYQLFGRDDLTESKQGRFIWTTSYFGTTNSPKGYVNLLLQPVAGVELADVSAEQLVDFAYQRGAKTSGYILYGVVLLIIIGLIIFATRKPKKGAAAGKAQDSAKGAMATSPQEAEDITSTPAEEVSKRG